MIENVRGTVVALGKHISEDQYNCYDYVDVKLADGSVTTFKSAYVQNDVDRAFEPGRDVVLVLSRVKGLGHNVWKRDEGTFIWAAHDLAVGRWYQVERESGMTPGSWRLGMRALGVKYLFMAPFAGIFLFFLFGLPTVVLLYRGFKLLSQAAQFPTNEEMLAYVEQMRQGVQPQMAIAA